MKPEVSVVAATMKAQREIRETVVEEATKAQQEIRETVKSETQELAKYTSKVFTMWGWSIVHNCLIHPMYPFCPAKLMPKLDAMHEYTATRAFDKKDETSATPSLLINPVN